MLQGSDDSPATFKTSLLSPTIKSFLVLNKGIYLFLQKVSAFANSFFNNLDSQVFLPTWKHLFLERFHPGRPQRNRKLGGQHGFNELEKHPWNFSSLFFSSSRLIHSISTNREATGLMPQSEDFKSRKRSINLYSITEIIKINMFPEDSLQN